MIVALIIAATLSSDSIGTFFTFPEWMPTEVASSNTPGSDPASGEDGWYIAETTNVLTHTWDVYYNSEQSPMYSEEYIWWCEFPGHKIILDTDTLARSIWEDRLKVEGEYYWTSSGYLVIGENDASVDYDEYVVVVSNPEETPTFKRYDFKVRLVRNTESTPTGLLVSRSPRLTTDVMAGVYSTFEAFYERMYYASQGQTNNWNRSQFGPYAKDEFRFDLPDGYGVFNYEPANRTITSRRLVEYDNISGLAGFMEEMSSGGFKDKILRTNWLCNGNEDRARIWWSTTDSSIFSGQSIVPTLNWVSNPTDDWYSQQRRWKNCCQCFCVLANDAVWPNGNTSDPDTNLINGDRPLQHMMEGISFGKPTYYNYYTCGPADVAYSMRSMIETNYPHADGWAITNDTRRLFSDRLCCMNQVLGLMDRTYHEPEVIYPTTGTNTTYYNDLTCRGVTSGRATFSSGKYVISDFSPVAWESDVTTNRNSGISVGSSGSAYHHRVSKTTTSADAEFACADDFESQLTPSYELADQIVEEAISAGFQVDDGDQLMMEIFYSETTSTGIMINKTLWNYSKGMFYDTSQIVPFEITNVNMNVYFSYGRRYDYAKTIGNLSLGPSQPGYQAGSRFKAGKFGRVIGQHKKSGNVSTTLDVMPWSTSSSGSEYCSDESPFGSRSSLVNQMQSSISSAYNRFVYWYGLTPTDWQRIIPINATDAENVKRSITITSTELTFSPHCVCFTVGTFANGIYQADLYESYSYDQSEFYDHWTSLARAELGPVTKTMDSPSQTEEDGLATDTKVGVMTRVDWSWKTLKRTED